MQVLRKGHNTEWSPDTAGWGTRLRLWAEEGTIRIENWSLDTSLPPDWLHYSQLLTDRCSFSIRRKKKPNRHAFWSHEPRSITTYFFCCEEKQKRRSDFCLFLQPFHGHTQASHYPTNLPMKIAGLTMWLHGRVPSWYAGGWGFDPSTEKRYKKRKENRSKKKPYDLSCQSYYPSRTPCWYC